MKAVVATLPILLIMLGLAADTSGALVVVVAGAVVAALGYVGRLIVAEWTQVRAVRAARLTSLIRLQALLRATGTAFVVQAGLRNQLYEELRQQQPSKVADGIGSDGYDQLFSELYPLFTDEQRELHVIIRAYTQHALRPVNGEILECFAPIRTTGTRDDEPGPTRRTSP